ncbi:MAG: hypothetical protein M3R44_01035 [Candidatus Eremiobacteraeota bacterium]|nr:hypothetical protein [Candidatus Eremiobacteraeota bacterium]
MKLQHGVATALLIAAASLPAAALAQYSGGGWSGYGNGRNGGYGNQGGRQTSGVIASVNGGDIRLTDGRNIFLENGTIINPRGTSLQAGQRISVTGAPGGNGAINAGEIDVNGYGYGGYGNDNGYGNGNGNGNRNGYGRNNGRWDRDDRRRPDGRDDNNKHWGKNHNNKNHNDKDDHNGNDGARH